MKKKFISCLKKPSGLFEKIFVGEYYAHDWAYKCEHERKCLNCDLVEIYVQDWWRKKLN